MVFVSADARGRVASSPLLSTAAAALISAWCLLPGMAEAGWATTVERADGAASHPATDMPSQASRKNDVEGPFRMRLGFDDRRAALRALQFALDEVGDGSTFVWHRKAGALSGTIKPTAAFLDEDARLCRHVVFTLTVGPRRSSIEAIACREDGGRWSL
ncbi:MAG: hypothetical protein AAFQ42_01160 [Pseudomonadota bacterium]